MRESWLCVCERNVNRGVWGVSCVWRLRKFLNNFAKKKEIIFLGEETSTRRLEKSRKSNLFTLYLYEKEQLILNTKTDGFLFNSYEIILKQSRFRMI